MTRSRSQSVIAFKVFVMLAVLFAFDLFIIGTFDGRGLLILLGMIVAAGATIDGMRLERGARRSNNTGDFPPPLDQSTVRIVGKDAGKNQMVATRDPKAVRKYYDGQLERTNWVGHSF